MNDIASCERTKSVNRMTIPILMALNKRKLSIFCPFDPDRRCLLWFSEDHRNRRCHITLNPYKVITLAKTRMNWWLWWKYDGLTLFVLLMACASIVNHFSVVILRARSVNTTSLLIICTQSRPFRSLAQKRISPFLYGEKNTLPLKTTESSWQPELDCVRAESELKSPEKKVS